MSIDGIRLMNKDMTGIMSKEEQAKLKEDNLKHANKVQPMSKNEKAKAKMQEASVEKNDAPVKKSKASDCCCMVAPWEISEEDRTYVLKVTKTKEQKVMVNSKDETVTVPDKEEESNKEKKVYELHVVTPSPDDKGKETFKKITSTHTFMKKKCELKMLVKGNFQEKTLDNDTSFKINGKGEIEGAIKKYTTAQEKFYDEYKTSEEIKAENSRRYEKRKEKNAASIAKNGTVSTYPTKDEFIYPVKVEKDKATELIISIVNPDSIAKKYTIFPAGSVKCSSQPKVLLYVHDKAIYKGELTISYGTSYTVDEEKTTNVGKHRNETIDVTRSAFKVEGKLEYELGSTHYIIEGKHSKGFDEDNKERQVTKVKRKPQHLKRIGAENIFGSFQKKINGFQKLFSDAEKAMNPKKEKDKKEHKPISLDTGLTKFTLKADGSYDEDNNDYTLKRIVNNFEIDISLFDGSALALDVLELGCMFGGPIGKVLSEARGFAEDHGQEFKLEFCMGGSIKGNLKFSRPDDKKPWTAEGKIGGTISIELVGEVKIDGSVLWVKVAAGASFKSGSKADENNRTEIAATLSAKTDKDDILIGGNLEFNGLTIYFAAYLEVGLSETKTTTAEEGGGYGTQNNTEISAKREFKSKGDWKLLDDWKESKNFGKVENFIS